MGALHSDNIDIMVINPKAMKHFGIAMMQRSKTDKIDSKIILEYYSYPAIPSGRISLKVYLHPGSISFIFLSTGSTYLKV